jgi:hypothetical protein
VHPVLKRMLFELVICFVVEGTGRKSKSSSNLKFLKNHNSFTATLTLICRRWVSAHSRGCFFSLRIINDAIITVIAYVASH